MKLLKRIHHILSMSLLMCPGIIRIGGVSSNKLPSFTFTGTYTLVDDGDGNWRIKFLTSGTLVLLGALISMLSWSEAAEAAENLQARRVAAEAAAIRPDTVPY